MTFDYRDADGDTFIVANNKTDAGQPVVWMATSPDGVYIDLDRVEEVVAGIRDSARTAARQTTGQDDTCNACGSPFPVGHLCLNPEPTAPAVGQPAEAHDTEQHRPPCTNGDHCGEPSHCPPSPAYERLQTIAAKTNREMAGATLRAYKRVYQLAHNATGPIEPSDILEALKDPKPDPAKLLAAIMSDTVEDER